MPNFKGLLTQILPVVVNALQCPHCKHQLIRSHNPVAQRVEFMHTTTGAGQGPNECPNSGHTFYISGGVAVQLS